MTIYKILSSIIFSCLIIIVSYFFYLYKHDRLIILYKKNHYENKENNKEYSEKLFGVFIENNEIIKIPLSITFDTFDKKNPEEFLYSILYQFFHYINLEKINIIQYNFNHVAMNNKEIIVNGRLEQIKKLSAQEEFYFLKSVFITIQNIFPQIESIYFYNDDQPLNLNHLLPFFTKNMIEKNKIKYINNYDEDIAFSYDIVLIPYFNGNGNIINGIFEKNIFQQYNNPNILNPKNKKNSLAYFQEINQYNPLKKNKLIIYVTIQYNKKSHVEIISYPTIPENNLIHIKEEYPQYENNNFINIIINKLKNKLNSTSCLIYPFIPIINTIYPSIYLLISATNEIDAINILEKINSIK